MREFILLALKAVTSPDFDIGRLPEAGRLDLVCRTVSNALCISNGIRRDTIVHVVMTGPSDPPKIVSFHGETLKGFEPDERAIAQLIKNALKASLGLKINEEKDVSPGIKVAKKAFETLAKEKSKTQMVYLQPDGEDIRSFNFEKDATFIFGDYIGLPKNTAKLLARLGAKNVTLGPTTLFASHCAVIVHNEIDRRQPV